MSTAGRCAARNAASAASSSMSTSQWGGVNSGRTPYASTRATPSCPLAPRIATVSIALTLIDARKAALRSVDFFEHAHPHDIVVARIGEQRNVVERNPLEHVV